MAGVGAREVQNAERVSLLRAVKAFHTFAWFTIEACMAYVLYAGLRGRTDRSVGLAAGVVAAETLVFAANGFHCPLTAVARDLGDATGSVTDIYLPHWFASNLPVIHVPLILAAVVFHWRNYRADHGASLPPARVGARSSALPPSAPQRSRSLPGPAGQAH